jgi:alkylhydroperoxidase family enzyme
MARITEVRNPDAEGAVLWQGMRPRMAEAAVGLSQAVYQETTLSYREAEAARIRIAHINGCVLCNSFRLAEGLPNLLERLNSDETANVGEHRGERPGADFYEAVASWRTSKLFSERERLAIEYAERIAEAPRELPYDDEFWGRIHACYDNGEIVDLTYSITTWIATGRFVHVLGLDGTCPTAPTAAQVELA